MTDVLGSQTFLRSDSEPQVHDFEYDIDSEIYVNGNVPVACTCKHLWNIVLWTSTWVSIVTDDETS